MTASYFDLLMPTQEGKVSVIPLTRPRRLQIQALGAFLASMRDVETPEEQAYLATTATWAMVGLCWADNRKIPNLPRRPCGDLMAYGEAVNQGLYDLGFDVESDTESWADAVQSCMSWLFAEFMQEEDIQEAEEEIAAVFRDPPEEE